MSNSWQGLLDPPLHGRIHKPRVSGITMLIDKGLSPNATVDLLEMNAPFIDFIKLTFGTVALYQPEHLQKKIILGRQYGVELYPGGTFFELAHWYGKSTAYFNKLLELGFKWVEISDGTIHLNPAERLAAINQALQSGLKVITEVGKKDSQEQPSMEELIATAFSDLEAGVRWVIIEARESGQGIGIYNEQGGIIPDRLEFLSKKLAPHQVIWEAPLKNQQAKLIGVFGPNVNLGNIPTTEIMALEALRQGYRSDTWKLCF